MKCPNCGKPSGGNFCAHCGTRLKWEPFRKLTTYREIIHDERCQAILASRVRRDNTPMTASEFLQYAEVVVPRYLPLAALASLAQKAGKKFNLGNESYGTGVYRHPYAIVLLALLVSLAKNGLAIEEVADSGKACLIAATIPSTVWNLEGKLEAILSDKEGRVQLCLKIKIFGQWLDWGKGNRLAGKVAGEVKKLSAEFSTLQELQ